jgi:hypothetical protein
MNEPEDIFSLKAALDSQSIEIEELQEEIKRLQFERAEAVRALNQIINAPYCAFVRNGWIERMVFVEIGLTYEFMDDCPDLMVETIAKEIKNTMSKATKPTNDWIQVDFKQEDSK